MTNKRKLLWMIAIILYLAALVSFVAGCRNAVAYPQGSFDFQYDSAKVFSLRVDPYKETMNSTGLSQKLGLEKFYNGLEANQFPSMLMLLLPYTLLSPMAANWAWMISNVLFSIGIVFLIKKLFFDKCFNELCERVPDFTPKDNIFVYSLFVAVFFMGLPWRCNIGNGQHTIMAFFFFLLSVWLFEEEHDILSGIALAISFFKYTLTVPLALYFFYKKKYKSFILAVGIHSVLTIVAALWLNTSVIDMIIEPLQIASHFTANGSYDIGAILGIGRVGMVITILSMVVMGIFLISGKYKGSDEELLSLLVVFSLVIVYHMLYDYFVLIVPTIVFTLKKYKQKNLALFFWWIFMLYIFFIVKITYVVDMFSNLRHIIDIVFALIFYISVISLALDVNKRDSWRNIGNA